VSSARARFPAHPFLVAIVPVWSLWASNADQVDPRIPLLATLASLLLCGALLAIARGAVGDWQRAGLLTSVWLVLFYVYGSLCDATSPPLAAAATGVSALGAGVWLSRTRVDLGLAAAVVTAAAGALLAYALFGLAPSALRAQAPPAQLKAAGAGPGIPAGAPVAPRAQDDPTRPDVYYLVLDGYAGADVLRDVFHTDNGPFLEGLRTRGFYVADQSRSNYAMTHQSLASVLNAAYLDALMGQAPEAGPAFAAPYALLRDPWVARFLRARGYRYAQIFTNWGGTERSELADVGYEYAPHWLRSEFTGVLLGATPLRGLLPSVAGFHRFAFEAVREAAALPGPTFLFAHILLPHEPYVFDREGQVRAHLPLHQRSNFLVKQETAAGSGDAAYADQLHFLNGQITRLVDDLLASSKTPPVILIQGDHGWASHSSEAGSSEFVRARFPILNAFFVPDSVRSRLYPGISSVNTFRVLLTGLFGAALPPLPDRHYLSWYDAPGQVREVTAALQDTGRNGH
jgi:hypothetical protein